MEAPAATGDRFRRAREAMVDDIANYSAMHRIKDPKVLAAMRKVPRDAFVPEDLKLHAYSDRPLPIGEGQTISQPFIVAYMTDALELRPGEKVLEIGTGSGYQAAILAEVVDEVYTIEIVETLGRRAERTLKDLGYDKVRVRIGDGYRGWPEAAPFDAVIVTCAPDHIPQPLVDQLRLGGRMMIPVGEELSGRSWAAQELVLVRKTEKGMRREKKMDVRFVPMTGEAQAPRER
ncbi:MAG: protein-L-isoaspartate(D-aspartate) O-methyltransferase [Elusimicrobiota bacterium]